MDFVAEMVGSLRGRVLGEELDVFAEAKSVGVWWDKLPGKRRVKVVGILGLGKGKDKSMYAKLDGDEQSEVSAYYKKHKGKVEGFEEDERESLDEGLAPLSKLSVLSKGRRNYILGFLQDMEREITATKRDAQAGKAVEVLKSVQDLLNFLDSIVWSFKDFKSKEANAASTVVAAARREVNRLERALEDVHHAGGDLLGESKASSISVIKALKPAFSYIPGESNKHFGMFTFTGSGGSNKAMDRAEQLLYAAGLNTTGSSISTKTNRPGGKVTLEVEFSGVVKEDVNIDGEPLDEKEGDVGSSSYKKAKSAEDNFFAALKLQFGARYQYHMTVDDLKRYNKRTMSAYNKRRMAMEAWRREVERNREEDVDVSGKLKSKVLT